MSLVVISHSRRAPDASATRRAAAISADPMPLHWRDACSVRISIDPPLEDPGEHALDRAVGLDDQRRVAAGVDELAATGDDVGVVVGEKGVDGRPIGRVRRADARLDRRAIRGEDGGDPESFDDDRRVVGDGERRVPEALANLVDEPVPVVLVRDAERGGAGIALALVDRVLVGHVRQPDHDRPDVLDHGHRPLVGVEQDRDVARLLHGLAFDLVVGEQVRRDDLAAAERERRQLVAQRARGCRTPIGSARATSARRSWRLRSCNPPRSRSSSTICTGSATGSSTPPRARA